jgi:hypothetical protein
MARIRTIKPELAAHEGLFDLERDTGLPVRFAWCMLFTVADREGRFAWRPRTLKAQILPHDEIDFSRVLDAWLTRGFIRRYRVKGEWYGWIPTFTKHQVINNREAPSTIPSIDESDLEDQPLDACSTRESTGDAHVDDACPTREVHAQVEGRKGKEGKGKGREGKDASLTRDPRALNAMTKNGAMDTEEHHEPTDASRQLSGARNGADQTGLLSPIDSLPFEQALMGAFPKGQNPPNWMVALRLVRELVDEQLLTWQGAIDVAKRYAKHLEAIQSSVNIAAHNFFDRRKGNYWQQTWDTPVAPKNGKQPFVPPRTTREIEDDAIARCIAEGKTDIEISREIDIELDRVINIRRGTQHAEH